MPGLKKGDRISHFEVLQKLGEGGMGVVYQARDIRLERLVALKVLAERPVEDSNRHARLVQEAKAASALNHPHIVTVHEIDTADGITFIAMEYIEGKTLDQMIPHRGLRLADVLKYAVQIAEGLAAAHAIGIVHRDVKPANVMVSNSGIVKVLDFGLAKQAGMPSVSPTGETLTMVETPELTRDGAVIGTAAYMSPEQAEGKPLDARSDIFSFGILLYEMLSGRRPFAGDNQASIMAALIGQEPKPVRQIVEGLPAEIDRIVSRCLRKDPSRRFQHMADLAVALAELKEESDSGSLAPAATPKPRRQLSWLVGSAVVVAVAATAVWMATRTSTSQSQTVLTVTNYAGSEVHPAFSPDGKQVAFSWDGEKGGNYDIYVKLIGETGALRLTSDPGIDENPVWSPDGKRIVFRRRTSLTDALYSMSALGGDERRLSSLPTFGQISWSPDGKWLCTTGIDPGHGAGALPGLTASAGRLGAPIHPTAGGAGLLLLPAEGGQPRRLSWPAPPISEGQPAFSRNGREIGFVRCEATLSCDVFVRELNADGSLRGEPRQLTRQRLFVSEITWSPDDRSIVYSSAVGASDTFLRQVDVSGRKPPVRIEIAGNPVSSPSFDPFGRRLIFSRGRADADLWKFHEGAGAEAFIASTAFESHPQFSPDGRRIAFQSGRSGTNEIYIANADGSQLRQLTKGPGRHQGTPRWSPDGEAIAFDSQRDDGHWDVWVIDVDDGTPRRLTNDPADEVIPSWSRDGKWIYYCSTRTGRGEIWRSPSAGGIPERVTRNGGHVAFESVDGKNLYYSSAPESPLMAAPTGGGAEAQLLPHTTRAFQPAMKGIYFVGRPPAGGPPALQFFDFATKTSKVLSQARHATNQGLAVSPDEKSVVFVTGLRSDSNIMMIENFR